MTRLCWVQEHLADPGPCDGHLIRAHLIPRSLMKREGVPRRYQLDPRGYVWVCGGPMGNAGHHGMLDTSRKLRIARWVLPPDVEEMAVEIGLDWWLAREYGERVA
jgi:hypothetical protein